MRTYGIAHGECVLAARSCLSFCKELYSGLCGDLSVKDTQKGESKCTHEADTICCKVTWQQ